MPDHLTVTSRRSEADPEPANEHQTSHEQARIALSKSPSAQTRWMRGPSTAMRGALLGLLLERPGHGGDLASRLASRLGETWRVDTNDVYRLLERLESTGLAVSRHEPTRRSNGRRHVVYHPTKATSEALTLWMETLLSREPVRLGLHCKLSVARPQDAPRLLIALKEYERECRMLAQRVAPVCGQARSWAALCIACTREAAFAQLQTEGDWAARTRRRIEATATPAI
jgi:DNA-binding PadR family transcriptional regulator